MVCKKEYFNLKVLEDVADFNSVCLNTKFIWEKPIKMIYVVYIDLTKFAVIRETCLNVLK